MINFLNAQLLQPFRNSCNGLRLAWTEDHSFRNSTMQAIIGTVLASVLVWYTGKTIWMWLILVGSLFPIVIIEMVNSSIEAVTDKASPERHPLAKKAKDIGSAAVLLSRLLTILCWVVVFAA